MEEVEKLNVFERVGASIIEIFAPIIKLAVKQGVGIALVKFKEKSEEAAKLAVVELYPLVDTLLEDLVAKTETKVDDATVDGIMEALEEYAALNGFELQNLDED